MQKSLSLDAYGEKTIAGEHECEKTEVAADVQSAAPQVGQLQLDGPPATQCALVPVLTRDAEPGQRLVGLNQTQLEDGLYLDSVQGAQNAPGTRQLHGVQSFRAEPGSSAVTALRPRWKRRMRTSMRRELRINRQRRRRWVAASLAAGGRRPPAAGR